MIAMGRKVNRPRPACRICDGFGWEYTGTAEGGYCGELHPRRVHYWESCFVCSGTGRHDAPIGRTRCVAIETRAQK
jgi:hypothetical protein